MADQLFLHEEILLLALRDHKGTIASGTNYQYAIGGAILAELILEGRVAVDTEKKKKFLRVVNKTLFGDPVLDECLKKVTEAKKRAQLRMWVSRFAGVKKLKDKVAIQLCRKNILRADEDKVLLIFTRKVYPELNPRPEQEIMKRLDKAIFTDIQTVKPRTAVLLSLAKSADVLKVNFDRKELKRRKKRIEQVINGDVAGKATKEAIEAMQAAVMVTMFITTS
jgi:Golgi phosphoprotein 3